MHEVFALTRFQVDDTQSVRVFPDQQVAFPVVCRTPVVAFQSFDVACLVAGKLLFLVAVIVDSQVVMHDPQPSVCRGHNVCNVVGYEFSRAEKAGEALLLAVVEADSVSLCPYPHCIVIAVVEQHIKFIAADV